MAAASSAATTTNETVLSVDRLVFFAIPSLSRLPPRPATHIAAGWVTLPSRRSGRGGAFTGASFWASLCVRPGRRYRAVAGLEAGRRSRSLPDPARIRHDWMACPKSVPAGLERYVQRATRRLLDVSKGYLSARLASSERHAFWCQTSHHPKAGHSPLTHSVSSSNQSGSAVVVREVMRCQSPRETPIQPGRESCTDP